MAMSLREVGVKMGQHPYLTGGAIVVGGLGILWIFGFFSKPAAASDGGQTNMAAAYYAAEAAQAAAGAQIQSISLQTTAATAQTQIAANAAVAINGANTGSAVLINGQNTGSANTINGQNVGRDVTVTGINAGSADTVAGFGRDVSLAGIGAQLQATQINANAATTQALSNNATAARVAQIGADATTLGTALRTVVPFEQSLSGGFAGLLLPGIGQLNIGTGSPPNINDLIAQGYSPSQAAFISGLGFPGTAANPGGGAE